MNYAGLKEQIVKLQPKEVRIDSTEAMEFVMAAGRADEFQAALEKYFGPPLKPKNQKPTSTDKSLASPHGGVRFEQTLFFKEGDGSCSIGLLWPWGNGESITVKIYPDVPAAEEPAGLWRKIKKIFGR